MPFSPFLSPIIKTQLLCISEFKTAVCQSRLNGNNSTSFQGGCELRALDTLLPLGLYKKRHPTAEEAFLDLAVQVHKKYLVFFPNFNLQNEDTLGTSSAHCLKLVPTSWPMGEAIRNINMAAGQKGNYETCLPSVSSQQNWTTEEKPCRCGAKRRLWWNQTVLTTRAHTFGTTGALGSVLQLPSSTGEGWAGPGAAGHLLMGTGAPDTSQAGPLRAVLHTTQPRAQKAQWDLEISLSPFQVPPLSRMIFGTDKKWLSDHLTAELGCEMWW